VQTWISRSATAKVQDASNIMLLGGSIAASQKLRATASDDATCAIKPRYLNTKLINTLKVLAGLIPAMLAFLYTQDWWLLAWFGALIFFGITGVRNILQSVVGGGGIFRTTLLRWNDYVSWARLCDSLLYTGISVPLLELVIRAMLLEQTCGLSVERHPFLVYTIISTVNGFYICGHNLYRGLPKEAAIANLFRSVLAVPVSVLYDAIAYKSMMYFGVADPYVILQPGAAITAKMASDTVAALIEGLADRQTNIRMRHWDYETKLARVFETYTRLELIFPENDVLAMLHTPTDFLKILTDETSGMESALIINALDLMYFWLYLPRAQDTLRHLVSQMSQEERVILFRSQLVLTCEQEVSQLLVSGLVGRNFGRALAFYLDRHNEYLQAMAHLCHAHADA